MQELVEGWDTFNCNHQVTVVLFARVFYPDTDDKDLEDEADRETWKRSEKGVLYRDFYRIVVNNFVTAHGRRFPTLFRQRLAEFESLVLSDDHRARFPTAHFGKASDGNLLEAMNLSLDALGRHYIDRSFTRTGLSLLVVTPGTGVFHVSQVSPCKRGPSVHCLTTFHYNCDRTWSR